MRRFRQRFIAQHMGGLGESVYGVWDVVERRWHSEAKLPLAKAESIAAELSILNNRNGRRPESDVRRVEPAIPVEIDNFGRRGELTCWVRESDGWYGYVRDGPTDARWYHADRLRPADSK